MKIGVFGDSFADRSYNQSDSSVIWYQYLKEQHAIDCFGEGGSSILFSANLITQMANNYDLIIWCVTTPGRFSLPCQTNNHTYHITTAQDECTLTDIEIRKKHKVCVDYLKYIFDWDTENFVGQAVVSYVMSLYKNIMVIPCFPSPFPLKFNLYQLSKQETEYFFPGMDIPEIYQQYNDQRPGHISSENQQILANLIEQNLQPGFFQTSYDNFVKPTQPFNTLFQYHDPIYKR